MLTVEQVSKKWGISSRRVRELCSLGRIEGVVKIGRSYLIPDDAEHPQIKKSKTNQILGENSILIICKNDNDIVKAVAHNFIINEYDVYCNKKITPLQKNHTIKMFNTKNEVSSQFKIIIFIDAWYKFDNLTDTPIVYIGQKKQKDCNTLQIIFEKLDFSSLTYHGKIFFSEQGVLKEIYNLLQMKIENTINLPLYIEIPKSNKKSNLIKKFGSIQECYNFFIEQYKTFDENDRYYTIAIFNDVEFSDSNQELDYLKAAIDAFDRGVNANLIYIYNEATLPIVCNHFSTRLYLKHANENSGIYLISKQDIHLLNPEYLNYIDEGIICYSDKSVYHDQITEFSLGYVNANANDLAFCNRMCENIVSHSTKVTNIEELEEFYELHK